MPTREDLQILQAQDLELKVMLTKQRIREFVTKFTSQGVYISFSGGKDSTVLLHLVREVYPDVEAVFVNTGLEYPEIQHFVKTIDNVKILYPTMKFPEVIKTYGYPFISKTVSHNVRIARNNPDGNVMKNIFNPHYKSLYSCYKYVELTNDKHEIRISDQCCDIMKKAPIHLYEKETGKVDIVATMCCESKARESAWFKTGCNAFEVRRIQSKPMSFWTEQDVLQYIKENNLPIASVYGDITINNCKYCTTGCSRTGCIFCGFGAHLEKGEGRFQRLKRTHPKQYAFCMDGGEHNSEGIWQPNKKGLGMKYVIDRLNDMYGDNFIKY